MKVKATDIARMNSASEVIFDALRVAITRGDLAEGETLRQDRIAQMFNVSRIPVREALMRLEEQGLVTTQRYRGAVVSALSIEEIARSSNSRPARARNPALLCRTSLARSVGACQRSCHLFATETDSSRWGDLNRDFHYSLYQDAGRPYYLQVVKTALGRVERYLRAQLVLTTVWRGHDGNMRQFSRPAWNVMPRLRHA